MRGLFASTMIAAGALSVSGCATFEPGYAPLPGQSSAIGSVLGSQAAYVPTEEIVNRRQRAQRLASAGIKLIPEAQAPTYIAKQDAELRRQTAGTGIAVIRQGNELLLRMPSSVTFASGSATLKPQFGPPVSEVARSLKAFPSSLIDVLGHTDASGNAAANQALSKRRADAVAAALTARGVSRARIGTSGHGASRPVAENDSEFGRAANRRIEIRIVPVTQADR